MSKAIEGLFALFLALSLVVAGPVFADEKDDAEKAATNILNALGNHQYAQLYDKLTSKFFKDKVPRDSFLANMTMSRAQLGKLTNKQLVDYSMADSDPGTGYKGRIYAFNFKTAYSVGSFYERVVVLKESDGAFRMSGVFGAPVQK